MVQVLRGNGEKVVKTTALISIQYPYSIHEVSITHSTTVSIRISFSVSTAVSNQIQPIKSSNDSHCPWLSRTRSVVFVRHHSLTHSQTPTEFSTASRWRARACATWARPSPCSKPGIDIRMCIFSLEYLGRFKSDVGLWTVSNALERVSL